MARSNSSVAKRSSKRAAPERWEQKAHVVPSVFVLCPGLRTRCTFTSHLKVHSRTSETKARDFLAASAARASSQRAPGSERLRTTEEIKISNKTIIKNTLDVRSRVGEVALFLRAKAESSSSVSASGEGRGLAYRCNPAPAQHKPPLADDEVTHRAASVQQAS